VIRPLRVLIALPALLASSVALAAALVPAPLRAAILARTAGYERGFSERPGPAVLAVVLGKSGAAADDGRAMLGVFNKLLKDARLGGRPSRVVQITHDSVPKTVEELKSQKAEIVYFASGMEGVINSVPAQEGEIRRILVCANGGDVALGCTLGVELDGDKPRLVLNLKQANATGLRFDPGLLRLARIVR